MTETSKRAPLEDVMVAMDVVDTLRHREKFVARELDVEGRRERLVARLREMYKAQGIEVTDSMLEEGVRALEEDRFSYIAPLESFSTKLARLYVKRSVWGKPLLAFLMICLVGWIVYFFTMVRPESVRQAKLPAQLQNSFSEISEVSTDDTVTESAKTLLGTGRVAMDNGRYDEAALVQRQLEQLLVQLKVNYQIRVVSRPDEPSGVWRIPDVNTQARNYYLIVEAIDKAGNVLSIPITSEESGKTSTVKSWGVRVEENIFKVVAADKRDDGIIQRNIIGVKKRGELKPSYSITTQGGAITEW